MYKYLVVENDEFARYLLSQAITDIVSNAQITEHCDAKETLNSSSDYNNYNHIFIDLFMPGLSGYELIKLIRKENITTTITVVTIENDRGMLNECIKAGANHILLKPINKEKLRQILI